MTHLNEVRDVCGQELDLVGGGGEDLPAGIPETKTSTSCDPHDAGPKPAGPKCEQ